ncbi:MAG: FHA domain-containing protein, partial [Vicinamibacteria bacterium]
LALIVHPASSPEEVRFRILDLRTAGGFTDARGHGRRAIEAERPYAAVCGDYALVFAPVTDPPSISTSDPERFEGMFDFDVLTNPETLEGLALGAKEEPFGELIVSSREGTGAVAVSRRAVGSGILLGRSDLCDGDGLLLDHHISRVHVLIVEVAGKLYAIDTASKNGVFGKTEPERTLTLDSGTTLSLAGFATVEWRFFH